MLNLILERCQSPRALRDGDTSSMQKEGETCSLLSFFASFFPVGVLLNQPRNLKVRLIKSLECFSRSNVRKLYRVFWGERFHAGIHRIARWLLRLLSPAPSLLVSSSPSSTKFAALPNPSAEKWSLFSCGETFHHPPHLGTFVW